MHGHWVYQGNPGHYELYGEADHLFHSEFGVDGVSSVRSLRKFLSEPHRKPVSMKDDFVWRHHGEWWDTYDRDLQLFGSLESLSIFSACSQWIQAEGLRFILEANRRRQFNNSGSIIWQLNEPWPNASCTNLVDYYKEPKMAYYWTKRAFAPLHASMDYRSLHWEAGQPIDGALHIHSDDSKPIDGVLHIELFDTAGKVLYERSEPFRTIRAGALRLGRVEADVPHTADGLFLVRLSIETNGTSRACNEYVFSTFKDAVYRSALRIGVSSLSVKPLGSWELLGGDGEGSAQSRIYEITNIGDQAAMFVYPIEQNDEYWTEAEDAYFCLVPGESRRIRVTCRARTGELFPAQHSLSASTGLPGSEEPDIRFYSFTSRPFD